MRPQEGDGSWFVCAKLLLEARIQPRIILSCGAFGIGIFRRSHLSESASDTDPYSEQTDPKVTNNLFSSYYSLSHCYFFEPASHLLVSNSFLLYSFFSLSPFSSTEVHKRDPQLGVLRVLSTNTQHRASQRLGHILGRGRGTAQK